MEIKADLHVHSEGSPDGKMSVEEIVKIAKEKGLSAVAICDHDAVMESVPEYEDFLIIPGTECSTELGHMLGLFVTEHIPSKPLCEAADAVHAQGGITVMAHPFEHRTDCERIDAALPHIDGVEVWNGRAERKIKNANSMAAAYASEHGKLCTAGSDAHVAEEIGNGTVTLEVEELTLEAVKKALLKGGVCNGTRGKAFSVAKSQLTRRIKTNAKPKSYIKWALFAAKCAAEDVFGGN